MYYNIINYLLIGLLVSLRELHLDTQLYKELGDPQKEYMRLVTALCVALLWPAVLGVYWFSEKDEDR
jgi:hypothetical protein